MTLEELQALVEKLESSNEALAAKNKELLGEVKIAKAKAKGADIDPTEHAQLQSRVEELEGLLKTSETKSKGEIDKLSKRASEAESSFTKYLTESELTSSVAKAGLDERYIDAVKALHRGGLTVKAENGAHAVLMGDKPIGEALAQWAASDAGAPFRRAAQNAGGGAAGGSKTAGAKKFADMSSDERVALFRTDPAAYNAAKAAG